MNDPTPTVAGFSGFSFLKIEAELTRPAGGLIGFSITNSNSEFIQQVRGFKGFTLGFVKINRQRIFHRVNRKKI